MDKEMAEKLQLHKEWNKDLIKVLDGKVYSISDLQPRLEYTYCDMYYGNNCAMTGINITDYEEDSYCVEVYPHGDKSQKYIARYHRQCYGLNTLCWKSAGDGDVRAVNVDDTWKYTEEAFEIGFENAEKDAYNYIKNNSL